MTLWIGHDNDGPLGVDMSLACEAATESIDLINCCFDIINRDVQVNANLARFRLCHCLKYEARLRVTALTQVDPARFRGPKRSAEQGAPKLSHSFRVNAVDGQSGPDVRHRLSLYAGDPAHFTRQRPDQYCARSPNTG